MPWRRCEFNGQEVFVRALDTGKPIVRNGLVEMRYRLGATKSYRTHRENLVELDDPLIPDEQMTGRPAPVGAAQGAAPGERIQTPAGPDTVLVYTDGASSGNPGPAGAGIWIVDALAGTELERSEYLGETTNNFAELKAIELALDELGDRLGTRHIHLFTDSQWSLGALVGGWKIKANVELVAALRARLAGIERLELLKIRGHAGDPGNEAADRLATMAARAQRSLRRERPYKPPR